MLRFDADWSFFEAIVPPETTDVTKVTGIYISCLKPLKKFKRFSKVSDSMHSVGTATAL